MTNILHSHTVKQLLGAGAGMAIATIVYFGMTEVADMNIKGLLVSTDTISNPGEVSINAKDVSDAKLRRITNRAQTVADTLNNADVTTMAETPLTNAASSRRAVRQFTVQRKELAAGAKTYANDPNIAMTEEDRLAIRAARVIGQPASVAASQLQSSVPAVSLTTDHSVTTSSIQAVAVSQAEAVHPGANITQTHSVRTRLPSSGLGLNLLVLVTLVVTFFASHTAWRSRFASLASNLRIG